MKNSFISGEINNLNERRENLIMETKMQNKQAMEQTGQTSKDSTKQTLDFITDKIKGKFIMLPQFIYSSNKKFNDAIKLDTDTDASLEDMLDGYENLFQGDDYYEELFDDAVFSDEMYNLVTVMRSYSDLIDNGNEDAGVNLMTMLFRIYQKTGNLEKRCYSALNKLFVANNDAAPYYLALDWILHSDKGWQDDFIVERGYDLMAKLAENGNWLANAYYEEKERYEKTNEIHREICGNDF